MTFNERYKNNVFLLKTFEFSLKIMDYTEILQENRKYVLANQILIRNHQLGPIQKKLRMPKTKLILYIS